MSDMKKMFGHVKTHVRRHGVPVGVDRQEAIADMLGISLSDVQNAIVPYVIGNYDLNAGIVAKDAIRGFGRAYSGSSGNILTTRSTCVASPSVDDLSHHVVADCPTHVCSIPFLPVDPIAEIIDGENLIVCIVKDGSHSHDITLRSDRMTIGKVPGEVIYDVEHLLIDIGDDTHELNEAFERMGWTAIAFSHADVGRAMIPAAWIAPDEHWMHNRGAVITVLSTAGLVPYATITGALSRNLKRLRDHGVHAASVKMADSMFSRIDEHVSLLTSLADSERQSNREREESLREISDQVSRLHRDIAGSNEVIARLSRGVNSSAINAMQSSIEAVEVISGQRPIASAESTISSEGALIIEAVTHPLVMHFYRDNDGCCDDCGDWEDEDGDDHFCDGDCSCHGDIIDAFFDIPPVRISIDTSMDRFGDGISIVNADDGGHVAHPHISNGGRNCFGEARGNGLPNGLADAWGRKDWDSIMRLITAWLTRHNPMPGSEYQSPEYLIDEHGESEHSRSGWLVPDTSMIGNPDPAVISAMEAIS